MVRALWNGAVIAESDDTVIIDGNHYFPADSVKQEYLVASATTTVCSWKGKASYYSLDVDGRLNPDAAWYYPAPKSAAKNIAGRIAFWHGVKIDAADHREDRLDTQRGERRSFFDRFRRHPEPVALGVRPIDRGDDAANTSLNTNVVADLDDDSFSTAMDDKITIVDFWAPWCGPCKQLHPLFDSRAAEHASDGLKFARVNVDESPGVATALNIMSIPTIIVFDGDGNEVEREIGLPGKRRLDQLVRDADSLARTTSGTVAGKVTGQGMS